LTVLLPAFAIYLLRMSRDNSAAFNPSATLDVGAADAARTFGTGVHGAF